MTSELWTSDMEKEAERIKTLSPEELFGNNDKRAKTLFRNMSKMFHPDPVTMLGDHALEKKFNEIFNKANKKWELWEQSKGLGKPPDPPDPNSSLISIGADSYLIVGGIHESENMKIFHLKNDDLFQDSYLVVSRHIDKPLNIERLKKIVGATLTAGKYDDYFPMIVKHGFGIPQASGKHPALLVKIDGFKTFRTLGYLRSLGKGILNPRDVAWIWRRVISVGAIHKDHNIPWTFDPDYEFIQPEVHANFSFGALSRKEDPGSTISHVARFMNEIVRDDIPPRMRRYLKAVENGAGDKEHPGQLILDFNYIIEQIWGPRKFHNFEYPKGYK